MAEEGGLLALIPARGGSKGIPGKNLRPLAGLPLIAHAVLLARRCPEINRLIVSTDSEEIADAARMHGAEVPFRRPAELAEDATPMWPVVRHALEAVEQIDGRAYGCVLLLDPTTVGRLPEDIAGALARFREVPVADGVIGVSQPEFNPIWHCVVEREGWMTELIPDGGRFGRRQDVPPVYRINASLYLWRAAFVRGEAQSWRAGRLVIYEVPEWRMIHIDTLFDLQRAEALIRSRLLALPWLDERVSR